MLYKKGLSDPILYDLHLARESEMSLSLSIRQCGLPELMGRFIRDRWLAVVDVAHSAPGACIKTVYLPYILFFG